MNAHHPLQLDIYPSSCVIIRKQQGTACAHSFANLCEFIYKFTKVERASQRNNIQIFTDIAKFILQHYPNLFSQEQQCKKICVCMCLSQLRRLSDFLIFANPMRVSANMFIYFFCFIVSDHMRLFTSL